MLVRTVFLLFLAACHGGGPVCHPAESRGGSERRPCQNGGEQ
jgi:hypothetical protein